ncbi:MAG: hypothetical protein AB7O47_09130 [Flavobacteriales bacterium]
MKKIKTVVMLVVLSGILATGCSKDKENDPVPATPTTPVPQLTKFGIATVTVEVFDNSTTYDAGGYFDLYFNITDGTNVLLDNYSSRLTNKTALDFPIMFSYASGWTNSPFVTYDINGTFFINLFDDDREDTPVGTYEYIGGVAFDLSQYSQTRPEFIYGNFNGTYIKLHCIWYTT